MLAGIPTHEVETPEIIRRLAGGHPVRAVWLNETGGITFEVLDPRTPRFVKWNRLAIGPDLHQEADRLLWAGAYASVPDVLDAGRSGEHQWLTTRPLIGETAVSKRWLAEPERAAIAIGRGLRNLHHQLPVDDCPFMHWSSPARMPLDPAQWPPRWRRHDEHRQLDDAEILARLSNPPEATAPVVCHGDPCAPNTIIGGEGEPVGHVDMGSLGVGDPWADLAVATWSLEWNYGPGHEQSLLDAYGAAADPERIAYYRLLWDLLL